MAALPGLRGLVRGLGAAEVGIGIGALVVGGRGFAVLVAASYAGFSGFVAFVLRRGGAVSSCGCLGRPDTPATAGHVGLTLAAAMVAAAVAVTGAPALPSVVERQPRLGLPLLGLIALGLFLSYLALGVLPALHVAPSAPPTAVRRPS